GGPGVETGVEALEERALGYLFKPIDSKVLTATVDDVVRTQKQARMRRAALDLLSARGELPDDGTLDQERFERALGLLKMVYQPIVCWSRRTIHGYEALVRSDDPQLNRPDQLFDAAERLRRLPDLGRAIRRLVAALVVSEPEASAIFVNLHPLDFLDDDLLSPQAPLSRVAERVVLEITERAALHEIE